MSTDTADTIHYPPTPPASQIFYGIPGDSEEAVNDAKVYVQQTIESDPHELTPEADTHHVFDTAAELESGDEDGPVVVRRSAGFRGSMSPGSSSHPQGYPGKDEAPKSSAGPDGYDAFENTNNKKKRKIPNKKQLEKGVANWKNWSSKGVGKKTFQKPSMFRTGDNVNSRGESP